jgi:phosphatidylserine/phosphatidylglycerophosphate/cardiolipin synthase-like enzyme
MLGAVARSLWFTIALLAVGAACNTAQLKQAPPPPASTDPPYYEGECAPEEECEGTAPPSPGLDAGRPTTVDGGSLAMSKGVTIQVQPSDRGAALLAAIRGAKKSVHMTMYLLSNDAVVDALGDLKAQGRDVKVVLNKKFPTNGGDNTRVYEALQARGVPVQWAPSAYTFTHAKTIIIDGEKVVIMTMNLTESSAATNREYIATDTDPEDVADAERMFDADFNNMALSLTSKLVVSPQGANHLDPRSHLTTLINSAKRSLDVEVQSLSDRGIVDAIILAHQANVAVRVVINGDNQLTPAQRDAIDKLKQFGVPVRALERPDLHAKAIVVDEEKLFVGSQNFTGTALFQNREVGLVTDDRAEAAKVRAVIAEDFSKAREL